MALYLVRHAHAGSRSRWDGDDSLRPLSERGQHQADALASRLRDVRPPQLLSSPFLRCVATLAPLARAIEQTVEPVDELGEGRAFEPVLDLLARLPDNSVLCSHGDVIPDTIDALIRRGTEVIGEPQWKKASVWILERSAPGEADLDEEHNELDGERLFSRATAWPPPG